MINQHPTVGGWRQVNLWCDDWWAAEQMAVTHLGPLLTYADDSICWWFVRKGPSWRLRLLPVDGRDETATAVVDRITTALTNQGAIHRWAEVIYEPEVHAFGGNDAMAVAHELFSADSRHLLSYLAQARTDHRRELGLLLGTRLLHAAGQDWYEQGDIWERVAAHRTGEHPVAEPSPSTVAAVRRLLTAAADTDASPLHSAPSWPLAFQHAGREFADLAGRGTLTRGLRAVLAHHLLFTFNRLGVSAQHQDLLATAASHVVFHEEHLPGPGPSSNSGAVRPATVSAVTTDTTTCDPTRLRAGLADYIRSRGTFRTSRVEEAFRTVPRHLFLPGVDLETAYAPRPVVIKRDGDGTAVSSASSPNLVAEMLELLGVQLGHRVLEIGAATGINAALLAELAGATGEVSTIELDDDLAAGARAGLAAAGYHRVEVIRGDGALGHPGGAPYHRVIVTAGAWDIAPAWWRQLAVGGRLVVPLRLHGSGLTRALPFDLHQPDRMVSTSALVCGFVPMRGAAEQAEHCVHLADDVVLQLDAADLADKSALAQALTYPAREHWTGIQVHDEEPAEHLDLWLATTSVSGFGRLCVGPAARAGGVVDPARRWAGATVYDGGTIVYLAVRPRSDEVNELGVVVHGPDGGKLVAEASDLLHRWARERPSQPTITAYLTTTTPQGQASPAADIIRPHNRLTIAW